MPRFFVEGCPKGEVLLGGEDGRHIVRSLRMRPGEALTLCDGQRTDYACTFVSAASLCCATTASVSSAMVVMPAC